MIEVLRWFRHWRGGASSRVLAILGTTIVVLLGALNLLSHQSLGEGQASADHTRRAYRVLTLAQQTLQSLERMESIYRGFLVTGREDALGEYHRTRQVYANSLRALQLLAVDQDEMRLWQRVQERADAWEHESVEPGLQLRRAVREGRVAPQEVAIYEATGNSAAYFSEMRQLLASATDDQRVLVGQRVEDDRARLLLVRTTTIWGTGILVALAIVITVSTSRLSHALGQLERADGALAESDERLRSVVEVVREVLFRADADGRWELLSPGWGRADER